MNEDPSGVSRVGRATTWESDDAAPACTDCKTIMPYRCHAGSQIGPAWLPELPIADALAALKVIWPKSVRGSGVQRLPPMQLDGASAIQSAALVSGAGERIVRW